MKYMIPLSLMFCCLVGCEDNVQSASGTKMAKVGELNTDAEGHTVEQRNIIGKIQTENQEDKVWYLYVISPFDRQVVLRSTVVGKVTSSGKRLTPKHLAGQGMRFTVGDRVYYTDELPGEDGTFGSSTEYIYWKDSKGRNRRHWMLAGQIVHAVDQEMSEEELLGEMQ